MSVAHKSFVAAQVLLPLAGSWAGAQPPKPPAGLPPDAVARLGQTRLRHADRPTCVVFAPDGKAFITGGDGAVQAWSVATGYGGVSRLCVFPDGSRIASAGAEEG